MQKNYFTFEMHIRSCYEKKYVTLFHFRNAINMGINILEINQIEFISQIINNIFACKNKKRPSSALIYSISVDTT